ncbi:uncharacterized protein ACOB8E_018993 isoform 1-T1 [Sarcophilus harrisii]
MLIEKQELLSGCIDTFLHFPILLTWCNIKKNKNEMEKFFFFHHNSCIQLISKPSITSPPYSRLIPNLGSFFRFSWIVPGEPCYGQNLLDFSPAYVHHEEQICSICGRKLQDLKFTNVLRHLPRILP